jgi:hypothetical protein
MVRPVDKTVIVKNDDMINRAQWAKRLANETLKSGSCVGGVSGVDAEDARTLINMAQKYIKDIENMIKGYAPATHNDIAYVAILADLTHPEVVEPHEEPGEA